MTRRPNKVSHRGLCPLHPQSADQRQTYTWDEFRDAFPTEGQHIEFKSSTGREALARTMVAFSNASGGVILVGVNDAGKPIHKGSLDTWMNAVHAVVNDGVREMGRYHLRSVEVDDYSVLAVCVSARTNGITQTSGGLPLIRRGEQDVALYGSDLTDLVLFKLQSRYDETITRVSLDEADQDLCIDMGAAYEWDLLHPGALEECLRSQGLLSAPPDKKLTVAGVLFLTDKPRNVLGKAFIEIRRYKDDTTADYNMRREIDGPVDRQIAVATRAVMHELGSDFVVTNLYRYELPKIPAVVLREAIANAVAHRSYEASGTATLIEIRPSSVVVTSPGGLMDPVTEENLRNTQAARNPRVIHVLRSFRLAEDAGRGIGVMLDEMAAAMLDPPQFRDLGQYFQVTLPVHSPIAPEERAWVLEVQRQGRLEPQDRLLLIQAARDGRIMNSTARSVLNVDQVRARAALHRLRDAKLLDQHGERGGSYYTLSTELSPPTFRMSVRRLLDYLMEHATDAPLTNRRVREIAKVDSADARALLEMLVNEGRLIRVGERRHTRYILP